MTTTIDLAQPWEGHQPDSRLDVPNAIALQLVADGWARRVSDPRPEPHGPDEITVLSSPAAPGAGAGFLDAAKAITAPTVAELQAEIDRRNEGRDDETRLPRNGTKAELTERLAADDAALTDAAAAQTAIDSAEAANAPASGS